MASQPELTKKTARNSLYNLGAFTYPIILSFVTTPYIVGKLGPENYGIFALATSFVGFLAFLDFGVSPALVKYVAEHNARGEKAAIIRFFSVAVSFYAVIGTLVGLGLIAFGATIAPHLFKVSPQDTHTLRLVFYLTGVGFLFTMLLNAYASLPGALQRFDLPSRLSVVVTTISVASTVLLVTFGKGVVALMALTALLSAASVVAYRRIDRRLVPGLRVKPQWDREVIRKLFIFGGFATIGTIGGTILFQFDKILIGSLLGAREVTFYVLPGNMALKINAAIGTITAVIFPLTSELLAKQELARLQTLYLRATRIVLTILVVVVTPMFILSHAFLLHWLGPEYAQNSTLVLQLLLGTYTILGLSNIATHLAVGAGKVQGAAAVSIACAVLNVILLFILIPPYGIIGAAMAFIISVIPIFIFIRYVERSIVRVNVRQFYTDTALKLAIPLAIGLLVPYLLAPHIGSLIVFLLVYFLTMGLAVASLFVFKLLDPADKELILQAGGKMTGMGR